MIAAAAAAEPELGAGSRQTRAQFAALTNVRFEKQIISSRDGRYTALSWLGIMSLFHAAISAVKSFS
jgi:hypothetical protein